MSYQEDLEVLLNKQPASWPLLVLSKNKELRERLAPTRDKDETPCCDCPKCMRQSSVTFNLLEKTWSCSNELCSAYGLDSPVLDLFSIVLDTESMEETMGVALQTLGVDLPERQEEEAAALHSVEVSVTYETKQSQFINLPSDRKEWNIFETVWDCLVLTDEHRKELVEKRGLCKENWLDDCGYKSSLHENYERTRKIIDMFPPNKLLESGIFKRDDRKQIVLASFLAGTGMKKVNGEMKSVPNLNPVIIPYIDGKGRIVGLRPHKANLTNKEFLKQENMEHYHRALYQLVQPYGECFLTCNSNSEKYTLVITEGEFKASALAMCGIAAMAVPGIQIFRNEHFKKALLDIIIRDDIRRIIVAFDREDKSHKPFQDQFEAEIYAIYMAIILERYQFNARVCTLPDDWMEGKPAKADWDGALAMYYKKAKGDAAKAINMATYGFTNLLKKTPELEKQFSFLNNKEERYKQHRLNKLLHEAKLFSGGDQEAKDAAEITRWFPPAYKAPWLNHEKIAQTLRDCVGGYYIHKNPTDKQVDECRDLKEKVIADLKELDEDKHIERRKLRAVILAIDITLYRMPAPVCDFTARSKYKIICPDGAVDRLVRFKDAHGRESKESFQVTSKDLSTATKFREFVTACGPYHWSAGQDPIDHFSKHLDVTNYNQTIMEIDMMGWHKEHKLWLLGDCAFTDGRCIFPDADGIIWHGENGYYFNNNTHKNFTQKPPILFPGLNREQARNAYKEMDWNQERHDCAQIMSSAMRLFYASYGDISGYLHIGGLLSFLAHPELLLTGEGAKPSVWVQGAKGSGKTATARLAMMLFGFPWDYNFITLSGTKVGIERSLMQYSCLPLHLDEWKNKEASDQLVSLIRSCFMQQTAPKGVKDNARNTRQVTPMTVPIVTGEDATIDPATESRFIQLTMSDRKRADYIKEHMPNSDSAKIFGEINELSTQFYRVGRYLFKHREVFVANLMKWLKEMKVSKHMNCIADSRSKFVYGVAIASYISLKETFGIHYETSELGAEIKTMIEVAAQETAETESSIFRNAFFTDAMTMFDGNVGNSKKLATSGYAVLDGNTGYHIPCSQHSPGARRYIYFASSEFYPEYEQWCASRRKLPDIALKNIQKELSKTPYFIKNKQAPRVWRFALNDSARKWWIMDYEMMNTAEKNIFLPLIDPYTEAAQAEDLSMVF